MCNFKLEKKSLTTHQVKSNVFHEQVEANYLPQRHLW